MLIGSHAKITASCKTSTLGNNIHECYIYRELKIEHVSGTKNQLVDFLSRLHSDNSINYELLFHSQEKTAFGIICFHIIPI